MPIAFKVNHVKSQNAAVLRIHGELDFEMRADFQAALNELMECSEQRLVVDLTRVMRMSSVFIGTLIDYAGRAKELNKPLVCLMQKRMATVCRESGLGQLANIMEPQGG